MMASNLPSSFDVDFYYCDAAPYIGSDYRHPDTDPARLRYMQERGVNLIKFSVGAKDVTTPTHDWVDTDFWKIFRPERYDFVQTAKAGPAEYPYFLLELPVVEYVTLSAGVDKSANIACSIHLSQWQRAQWFRSGGDLSKSAVIPIPAEPPATGLDMRGDLGIPSNELVAGFHQRVDEHIFSPIPLQAFAKVARSDWHFILMGGGEAYKKQARQLGLRNVHFVPHSGSSEQISRFLNSLDVFAHGRSDGETFGTVFAEAMMHGRPCLSHRSAIANAQPETMGPAGLFAESAQDYADKLERLLVDSSLRQRLASKARRHAEEYYSIPACVDELTRIYAKVVDTEIHSDEVRRIEYGHSELGFLYAGELSSPTSPAYHILSGTVSPEIGVHLVRHLSPFVKRYVDIGASTGIYGCLVAKDGAADAELHEFELEDSGYRYTKRTVWLNNWEDRVVVHRLGSGRQPSELESRLMATATSSISSRDHSEGVADESRRAATVDDFADAFGLSRVDLLRIDARGVANGHLEGARRVIARDCPVLLLDLGTGVGVSSDDDRVGPNTFSWLHAAGYKTLECTDEPKFREAALWDKRTASGLYVALHKVRHVRLELGLRERVTRLAKQMRRERYRRRWSLAKRALKNPSWAFRRVLGRTIQELRRISQRESALTSYGQHHSEYARPDALARHLSTYRTYEEQDLFNHPENRFGELIGKHPEVRGVAVDIGAGAGWLSARLSRDFGKVIAIEPSAAAVNLAKQMYSDAKFGNIEWVQGMAQEMIRNLRLDSPSFFVTGCVLSHLPDNVAEQICSAINKVAPQGSILAFAECWGPESHEFMWHVRTQEWWRRALPGWKLDFHGPQIQGVSGRHKGIHGVRVG